MIEERIFSYRFVNKINQDLNILSIECDKNLEIVYQCIIISFGDRIGLLKQRISGLYAQAWVVLVARRSLVGFVMTSISLSP